jgi:hypothetical protein
MKCLRGLTLNVFDTDLGNYKAPFNIALAFHEDSLHALF